MRLVVLVSFFLGSFTCFIQPVRGELPTEKEMTLVCQNWLNLVVHEQGSWAGVTDPAITRFEDVVSGERLLARCYIIEPRGYIVVPNLKELSPVKAYSDECDWDLHGNGGAPVLIRDVLEDRLNRFVEIYGSIEKKQDENKRNWFSRNCREKWEYLSQPEGEFRSQLLRSTSSLRSTGPLLNTYWHQNYPYNNNCPMGDGSRCIVGCVATALAQVMRYHEWPPYGNGSYSYDWDGDDSCNFGSAAGAGELTAYFGTPYDWDNMPTTCYYGCTAAEKNALANLCYDVGVACEMDYGACSSGAYMARALQVLPEFFYYDDSIDLEYRSSHSANSWFNMIKTEIDAGRPMFYTLRMQGGGHAIVCDGWRETGGLNQYHMNYGWGGGSTAWYTVDDLNGTNDPYLEELIRRIFPAGDCNDNKIFDSEDISTGYSLDCQNDGVPDECQIAGNDCNGNSIPDDCETAGLITVHPADQFICPGGSVYFSLTASGATSYQWYKDGGILYNGGRISGVNTDELTISDSLVSDAGEYTCVVNFGCLEAESIPAALVEVVDSVIVQQPAQNIVACAGNAVQLSFEVSGVGLDYVWQKDGEALIDDSRVTGANSSTLMIAGLQSDDQGEYRCLVSDPCGESLLSDESIVSLESEIVVQPQDTCAEIGGTARFTVRASCVPGQTLSYYWRKGSTYLTDGGAVSGSHSDTLTITGVTGDDAGMYRVTILSQNCDLFSMEAFLTIGGCPTCSSSLLGDMDNDGDYDLADLQGFTACYGTNVIAVPECVCANIDDVDDYVNSDDWQVLQMLMVGPR